MIIPEINRDLSREAYLWSYFSSPAYTDGACENLKILDGFLRELQETHPIGQHFAPAVYWGGVIRELLETYPNARAMLQQEGYEAMKEWSIRLGSIGRGFTESAMWMGVEDFREILSIHGGAYRAICNFEVATRMSIKFANNRVLVGEEDWHIFDEDAGFVGGEILACFDEVGDVAEIPEYLPNQEVSSNTGQIVPRSGVWVPAGGMGTAALALARQGQMMQPMYPVIDVDENGYESVQPMETEWHLVEPTGRMISLRTPEAKVRRVPAGQPCPRSGWWYTPAKMNSKSQFTKGEIFPKIENSDYGDTFWLWSPEQVWKNNPD